MRKWKTKKKKHGDRHFESGPRGVLGSSYLKLFLGKLKSRWLGSSKETNVPSCSAIKMDKESPTRRIKVNVQWLKEYLQRELNRAKSSKTLTNPQ
ncbi:hypothetical protein PanWU01x14_367800 [Parasponia andersonii]|uniref:Uncharacterized protein n=1 Tax=Parasponia andersonii TaxID=3476 RepID=A0A2P5A582_PARAD|nr:hypothetical protein PanWU01x14_367800 [Parasponia andersonii]